MAYTEDGFKPIPPAASLPPAKVALGKRLFHDPRLSRDSSISCASCHDPRRAGVDHQARSRGIDGKESARNAPTVFNAVFNAHQFWDGRADSLKDQIDGPITNPAEMDARWPDVVDRLRTSPADAASFQALYPDGVTPDNIKDALASFETTLVTPNSRFDRFLRGDRPALSATEQRGLQHFKAYGCAACHQGLNLGGNMFQTVGLMADYVAERGGDAGVDLGRYNVTGAEVDRRRFKVPSLRNVAATAPYFHDGSVRTLEEAVGLMSRYQLGRTLSKDELTDIVAFLQTLTGEYEGKPL
jgi:cytochrome c peroxidase